jgi:hypothetical protein
MYKALKSAQNDIQEALLKFADETTSSKNDTSRCPRGEPCQCALITQSVPKQQHMPSNVPYNDMGCKFSPGEFNERFEGIEGTLQFLHQKQNAQYEVLVKSVQDLNISMSNIVKLLINQAKDAVETATTIPNLSPQAQASDLKNVCVDVSHAAALAPNAPQTLETPQDEDEQSAIAGDITPDIDEEEEEEEEEEVVPDEEEEVVPDEEEEGIEVEEWTYKGRQFFKDSENKVYANNGGEIGDAIGIYDPVKNIVKKIPAA